VRKKLSLFQSKVNALHGLGKHRQNGCKILHRRHLLKPFCSDPEADDPTFPVAISAPSLNKKQSLKKNS